MRGEVGEVSGMSQTLTRYAIFGAGMFLFSLSATFAMAGIFGSVLWADAIEGKVLSDGKPVANLSLKRTVYGPGDAKVYEARTDVDGVFTFESVAGGRGLPLTQFASGEEIIILKSGDEVLGLVSTNLELRKPAEAATKKLVCDLPTADRTEGGKPVCKVVSR